MCFSTVRLYWHFNIFTRYTGFTGSSTNSQTTQHKHAQVIEWTQKLKEATAETLGSTMEALQRQESPCGNEINDPAGGLLEMLLEGQAVRSQLWVSSEV